MNARDFNRQPPTIRSALVNASIRYVGACHPPIYFYASPIYTRRAVDLAIHQRTFQLFNAGSWNPQTLSFVPNSNWEQPDPSYPLDLIGYDQLPDAYHLADTFPGITLRDKVKPTRSYWTGESRRRRNL